MRTRGGILRGSGIETVARCWRVTCSAAVEEQRFGLTSSVTRRCSKALVRVRGRAVGYVVAFRRRVVWRVRWGSPDAGREIGSFCCPRSSARRLRNWLRRTGWKFVSAVPHRDRYSRLRLARDPVCGISTMATRFSHSGVRRSRRALSAGEFRLSSFRNRNRTQRRVDVIGSGLSLGSEKPKRHLQGGFRGAGGAKGWQPEDSFIRSQNASQGTVFRIAPDRITAACGGEAAVLGEPGTTKI